MATEFVLSGLFRWREKKEWLDNKRLRNGKRGSFIGSLDHPVKLTGEMVLQQDARMIINFENPAMWKVVNPNKKTSCGNTVGYSVKPSSNALSLLSKDDYPQVFFSVTSCYSPSTGF